MRTLLILLLLVSTGHAQTTSKPCEICGAQSSSPHRAKRYPAILKSARRNVCRVRVSDGNGIQSWGSGVLLKVKPKHIFTAHHVIRDRVGEDSVSVTWDGKKYVKCKVIRTKPEHDGAILIPEETPEGLEGVRVAKEGVEAGEHCYAFGFGGTGELKCYGGIVVGFCMNKHNEPVWYSISNKNRQGDSGGPIFVIRNGEPQVIGNQWGCGYDPQLRYHTISGTRLRVLRRLFGWDR